MKLSQKEHRAIENKYFKKLQNYKIKVKKAIENVDFGLDKLSYRGKPLTKVQKIQAWSVVVFVLEQLQKDLGIDDKSIQIPDTK